MKKGSPKKLIFGKNFFKDLIFGNDFEKTQAVTDDYWSLWYESELLDFICNKIRKKYKIPNLDFKSDAIYHDEYYKERSIEIEHLVWYEGFQNKNKLDSELNQIIEQLRLPLSAKRIILFCILYKTTLTREPLTINIRTYEEFALNPFSKKHGIGYTPKEIKIIENFLMIILERKIKYGYIPLDKKVLFQKEINFCLKANTRKIRPIKKWRQKLLIIELAKNQKNYLEERNPITNNIEQVRQTSNIIATKIGSELDEEIFLSANSFRKELSRLKKNFPILKELIELSTKNN